jgi:trehalose 6-phosphate phosphatase
MKDIFSPDGRKKLESLRQDPKALLAFDFDGTLAPLCPHPDDVRLAPSTKGLLKRLCRSHLCVVVTGRALGDLEPKLRGIPFLGIIGSHGMEWTFGKKPLLKYVSQARQWREELEGKLPVMEPGILLEDKKYSLSVHWRQTRRKSVAERQVLGAVRKLAHKRLIKGKQVINVIPEAAPDKGQAFQALLKKLRIQRAFYIGDDVTDEFVFRAKPPRGAEWVCVRVGNYPLSHASYRLKRQTEIDSLLQSFL